jgi:hypothetical protein
MIGSISIRKNAQFLNLYDYDIFKKIAFANVREISYCYIREYFIAFMLDFCEDKIFHKTFCKSQYNYILIHNIKKLLRKAIFFSTCSAWKCAALFRKHNEFLSKVSIISNRFFVLDLLQFFFSADGNFEVTLATKATLYNTGNQIPSFLDKYSTIFQKKCAFFWAQGINFSQILTFMHIYRQFQIVFYVQNGKLSTYHRTFYHKHKNYLN